MITKRITAVLLCLMLFGYLTIMNTASAHAYNEVSEIATQSDKMVVVSQDIIYIDENIYYIETVYEPVVQTFSNSKFGTKTATCYSSGTAIFSVSVTGTFNYDGITAEATSASKTVVGHVSSATLVSASAYTSSASAIASATISYNGVTLQKTVTLTCDKDGNLS